MSTSWFSGAEASCLDAIGSTGNSSVFLECLLTLLSTPPCVTICFLRSDFGILRFRLNSISYERNYERFILKYMEGIITISYEQIALLPKRHLYSLCTNKLPFRNRAKPRFTIPPNPPRSGPIVMYGRNIRVFYVLKSHMVRMTVYQCRRSELRINFFILLDSN